MALYCAEQEQLNYRDRIYQRYASVCKEQGSVFDVAGARKYASAFSHYLNGWLPAHRNARILDLACGSGRTLFLLKQEGYTDISGVDISPEQVALASQVTPDVFQGNGLDFLADKPRRYELIIAQDIIEHLNKDELFAMLDACHNALTAEGRLILSTPNAESPMFGCRRYGDLTHESCFTASSLAHALAICGFEEVAAREICPYFHGCASGARVLLWWILRRLVMFYNMIEIGHAGSGICSRDFLMSAVKPSTAKGA